MIGTMLGAGAAWTYVVVLPHVLAVGWLLFGIATLRARVFGPGASALLIAGAVIAILPLPSRTLVLSLAAAWLGMKVLGRRSDPGATGSL